MSKSILEQIARDMKQGTFPEKSKDTLLEEAAARIEALEAALREIAAMDPKSIRADDLGRAARIASGVLAEGQDK